MRIINTIAHTLPISYSSQYSLSDKTNLVSRVIFITLLYTFYKFVAFIKILFFYISLAPIPKPNDVYIYI